MAILMLSRFQNKILVNPVYHKNVFKSDLYTIVILNNILVYNSACHIHNYSSWVMGWLIVMVILLSFHNEGTRVCPQWINYSPTVDDIFKKKESKLKNHSPWTWDNLEMTEKRMSPCMKVLVFFLRF